VNFDCKVIDVILVSERWSTDYHWDTGNNGTRFMEGRL